MTYRFRVVVTDPARPCSTGHPIIRPVGLFPPAFLRFLLCLRLLRPFFPVGTRHAGLRHGPSQSGRRRSKQVRRQDSPNGLEHQDSEAPFYKVESDQRLVTTCFLAC